MVLEEKESQKIQEKAKDLSSKTFIGEREAEVAIHIANGNTRKNIAEEMDIKPATVSGYKSNLKDQLKKSEKTLNIIQEGLPENKSVEELNKQSHLSSTELRILKKDKDRSITLLETENKNPEYTDMEELAQDLEIDYNVLKKLTHRIREKKDKLEKTIKELSQLDL